jgi:transposase
VKGLDKDGEAGRLRHTMLLSQAEVGMAHSMTERMEQRYCIKFCQKLGDSKVETIRKIQQAFGDDAMGAVQIKEWFNRFKDGCTLADSDQRSGRPSTSQNANVIENVRSLILEDRRLTVREIADKVGISTGSAHSVLTEDLHMCRVVAKFVPKLLSQEQQQLRLEVAWGHAGVRQRGS